MSKPIETNDHREVSCSEIENGPLVIALIPIALAAVALILGGCSLLVISWSKNVGSILFGIAGTVLIFDLPVCVCVLIGWIRTGKPPALHLSPLIPCREERELHRRLRERPKLGDDAFFETYFAASGIPRDVPIGLRRIMERATGVDMDGVHPDDNLAWVDTELDFADVLYRIEVELGVVIPTKGFTLEDCRFGTLVERIAKERAHKLRI